MISLILGFILSSIFSFYLYSIGKTEDAIFWLIIAFISVYFFDNLKPKEDKDSEVLTKPFYIFKLTVGGRYVEGVINEPVSFEEALRMLEGCYEGCRIIYLNKNDN